MYGLVVKRGDKIHAAVSPSKQKLKKWSFALYMSEPPISAWICAWRMRDKTGWISGSDNCEEIEEFPVNAVVIWD